MGWWPWSKRVRSIVRVIRAKFDSAQTTPDNRRHWAKAVDLAGKLRTMRTYGAAEVGAGC
jgi:hypothetical protein